jgi:hypothetical protein
VYDTNAAVFSGGTMTFKSVTGTTISFDTVAGTTAGPALAYYLHRSETGGFTPSSATRLKNITADIGNPVGDTTVNTRGKVYFYCLETTDGTNTAYSTELTEALWSKASPLGIGFIGSSTWANAMADGAYSGQTVAQLIATRLTELDGGCTVSIVNKAEGSTWTYHDATYGSGWLDKYDGTPNQFTSAYNDANWANSRIGKAITAFKAGNVGVVAWMLGSNNYARGDGTVARWLADMQLMINGVRQAMPGVLQVLFEIGYRSDGGQAGVECLRQFNAARSQLAASDVLVASAPTLAYQATHLSNLVGGIHQNATGSIALATEQAQALSLLLGGMAPTSSAGGMRNRRTPG